MPFLHELAPPVQDPGLPEQTSVSRQGPEFVVLLGSAALPYVVQGLGTAKSTHEYVRERVGADGLEYMPGHNVLTWQIVRRAKLIEASPEVMEGQTGELTEFDRTIQELIPAGHSSFIQGTESGLKGWFFRAIYPRWDRSLSVLTALKTVIKRKPSVVMYGESGYGDDYSEYTQFDERTVQPKVSVLKEKWGLSEDAPILAIEDAMRKRGIDALTWDTAHGEEFENSTELLRRLLEAGLVQRFHLSVGRSDQKKHMEELGKPEFAEQTDTARDALIASPEKALETKEGQQLAMYIAYMHKKDLPAVVVLEEMPQFGADKAQWGQRQIVANIRKLRNKVLGILSG